MSESPVHLYCPSSLQIAEVPWVFTQRGPLGTTDFIKEAKARGQKLELDLLRHLYKHGLLTPLYYVETRRVSPPIQVSGEEPDTLNTLPFEYRRARSKGNLQDLASVPFRPRLRFHRPPSSPRRWWNGLLYSHYQLLALSEFRDLSLLVRHRRRGDDIVKVFQEPHLLARGMGAKFRGIALAVTALEARYLPNLDREWIRLTNTDHGDWERYRANFDPVSLSAQIGYSPQQALNDAQFLLLRANRIDPLDHKWRRIVRRTSRDTWKTLKNDALIAMDLREAAEILLRFYEDLVSRGATKPLPDSSKSATWHPLHDRLSHHPDTLDQELMQLGLSPHPRVVLAVEGDSEQVHAPRIWTALGYSHAPELFRVLKLGGVDRDLEKVAALAVAPLVADRAPDDYWSLIKPPARLMIAVDPEGKYFGTPSKVEKTRNGILDEIRSVLAAQHAEVAEEDLAQLIGIHTWAASCYEFAHFTDEDLAAAIRSVHRTCNGLDRDALVRKVGAVRSRGRDIKEVWSAWDYKVSKVKLAEALWPTLEGHIGRLRNGEDLEVPEIVTIVEDAYLTAHSWRRGSFVMRAVTE